MLAFPWAMLNSVSMPLSFKRSPEIAWPKSVTEMHVHLGGSVPLYRLWEIAVDRGIRGIGEGYDDFIRTLNRQNEQVHDLDSYLEVYDRIEMIQSGPQAVRESIIIAVHGAYRTGGLLQLGPGGEGGQQPLFKIGRLELRFNPLKRTGAVFLKGAHAGLYDVDRIILAACDVAEELEISFKGELQVGLIFCFGRDMTFEANTILARKTREWSKRSKKIIGVDLAGHESVNPLSSARKLDEMRQVFDLVGSSLPRTIHAGETRFVDVDTFVKTVEALNPQRVAHPICALRAYWENKNDRGLKLLKERGIICELCVKSNLLTEAVSDLEQYGRMLKTLDKFGIKYTFSTDAPALQVTSLAEELMSLINAAAASPEQVLQALQVAQDHSFLPQPDKLS